MNIFKSIQIADQYNDTLLGTPSIDDAHRQRRLAYFAQLTGGNGFRVPAKSPRVFPDGTTRGDRRRKLRALINDKAEGRKI